MKTQGNPTMPRLEYIAKQYPLPVVYSVVEALLEAIGEHSGLKRLSEWAYRNTARWGGAADYWDRIEPALSDRLGGSARYDRILPFVAQSLNRMHKPLEKQTEAYTGLASVGHVYFYADLDPEPDSIAGRVNAWDTWDESTSGPRPSRPVVTRKEQLVRERYREAILAYEDIEARFVRGLRALTDYAEATGDDLGKYKTEEQLLQLFKLVGESSSGSESVAGAVVHSWPDGWTVQELTTQPQLDYEGDAMQHCVDTYRSRDGGVYYENARGGPGVRLFSLRSPRGAPHLTLEWDLDQHSGSQFRGKQNAWPKREYAERMVAFRDEFLESDPKPASSKDVRKAKGLMNDIEGLEDARLLGVAHGGRRAEPYMMVQFGDDEVQAYYLSEVENDFARNDFDRKRSSIDAGSEKLFELPWFILKSFPTDMGYIDLGAGLFDPHSDEMIVRMDDEGYEFKNQWSATSRAANPRTKLPRHSELKRRLMR